eukprot:scaffold28678_cov111-Isochrysis_galbana.AAC.3
MEWPNGRCCVGGDACDARAQLGTAHMAHGHIPCVCTQGLNHHTTRGSCLKTRARTRPTRTYTQTLKHGPSTWHFALHGCWARLAPGSWGGGADRAGDCEQRLYICSSHGSAAAHIPPTPLTRTL